MKKISVLLMCVLPLTAACKKDLKSDKDKISYFIGQQIGQQVKSQGLEVNSKILGESIADVLAEKESRLSQEEMGKVMTLLQEQMRKKQQEMIEKNKKLGETNKKAGEAFLAKNKSKKGVKTTASGLQYMVMKEGKGKKPKSTDRVKVHYKGTLLDGKEFDSSYKRNAPATFGLNQVIKGWTEGLQLMPVGSKYKFFIPSQLAYGPSGQSTIPPHSTLVFEVELLSIEK